MRLTIVCMLLMLLIGTKTQAQPVLPADVPLRLDALRAVITVNGNGTQSVILDWEYDIYPPQAVMSIWLLPVPSEPIIELLPKGALDRLSNTTIVRFHEPDTPCPYVGDRGIVGYDYRDVTITQAEYVRGDRLMMRIDDWLAKGFWVDTTKHDAMLAYIEDGFGFVALTVPLYGNEEGGVSPVKLTYRADAPTLHTLHTTSYAQVWVFADVQYAPQNYAHPNLDYARFHTTSQTAANFYIFNYVQGRVTSSAYDIMLRELAREHEQYFVTEYATPTSYIDVGDDPLLNDLTTRFVYMTSFRGRVATDDPIFEPAPHLPDVPNEVNLADYVDPHTFWGCEPQFDD